MRLRNLRSTNSWGGEGRLSLIDGGSQVLRALQGVWAGTPLLAVMGQSEDPGARLLASRTWVHLSLKS